MSKQIEETQETVGNEVEETQGSETVRNPAEGLSPKNEEKGTDSTRTPDESVESGDDVQDVNATDDDLDTTEDTDDEPDTFPRDYVEKLRDESAKYRQRAQRADDLAQRLHVALTAATGRLQDADDLPFDEKHIDDSEALTAAIDDLLKRKPHLASRKLAGNVGQGTTETNTTVDLAGLLRSRV